MLGLSRSCFLCHLSYPPLMFFIVCILSVPWSSFFLLLCLLIPLPAFSLSPTICFPPSVPCESRGISWLWHREAPRMHRWCSGFPSLYFPENPLALSHSWEQMVFLQIRPPWLAPLQAQPHGLRAAALEFSKGCKRKDVFFELAPFCLSASLSSVLSCQLVGTCLPGAVPDLRS